jgi:hypothetical protein
MEHERVDRDTGVVFNWGKRSRHVCGNVNEWWWWRCWWQMICVIKYL